MHADASKMHMSTVMQQTWGNQLFERQLLTLDRTPAPLQTPWIQPGKVAATPYWVGAQQLWSRPQTSNTYQHATESTRHLDPWQKTLRTCFPLSAMPEHGMTMKEGLMRKRSTERYAALIAQNDLTIPRS